MTVPGYVAYNELGGSVAMVAALILGFRSVIARTGWQIAERVRIQRAISFGLIAWFAAALALSWFGYFRGAADRPPTIGLGAFLPIIAGAIVLWKSETMSRIIDAAPQSWLVGVQFYRILGFNFLALLGIGTLPGAFALPAGVGDVLVGVLAPLVALMYACGAKGRDRFVLAWNVLGLLDLLIALTTGFLTSPSPLQLLSLNVPNELITAFPLVMIPVFIVPVSVLLHLMSLIKLRRAGVQPIRSHSGIPASAH
jgi:hypothetical protein